VFVFDYMGCIVFYICCMLCFKLCQTHIYIIYDIMMVKHKLRYWIPCVKCFWTSTVKLVVLMRQLSICPKVIAMTNLKSISTYLASLQSLESFEMHSANNMSFEMQAIGSQGGRLL
jgi:hypothetical protein